MKRALLLLIALPILAGCSNQQKVEASQQADKAKQQANSAAQRAKATLADDSITFKVKSAMGASDKLDTSNLHVSTKAKVLTLSGSVTSEEQRALADNIAKDTVGKDVQIIDQLQIVAKQQPHAQPAGRRIQ